MVRIRYKLGLVVNPQLSTSPSRGLVKAAARIRKGLMLLKIFTAAFVVLGLTAAAPAPIWRALNPENTLIIETTKGRIIVEMAPALAPLAVARVRLLSREGVYDGLQFHRVIDHFVDQTGNPNNRDGGASSHPDLPPEFTFRITPDQFVPVRQAGDGQQGFVGATPVEAVSLAEAARSPDRKLRGWGVYCPGVVGMGRQADPGTANSEIFFMRDAARRLDHDYTVWGRVVIGRDVVRAMNVGEPPSNPDKMLQVRVASDLDSPPRVEIMDTHGPGLKALVHKMRRAKGADFTICDIEIPARIANP